MKTKIQKILAIFFCLASGSPDVVATLMTSQGETPELSSQAMAQAYQPVSSNFVFSFCNIPRPGGGSGQGGQCTGGSGCISSSPCG